MTIFIGTLIVFTLCALALGLGMLLGGNPLKGSCGGAESRRLRCLVCPVRRRQSSCRRVPNPEFRPESLP